MNKTYDAAIIGGGPAGATAAAILAAYGRDVLLVEKEKFPRYHVGESLMPYCYFTLERLDLVGDLMSSAATRKYSVQFAKQDGAISDPFYFFQHADHPSSTTWQVWRSEFDNMILSKAKDNGAEVWEETKAKALRKEGDRVTGLKVESKDGKVVEIESKIVIDASGRDNFSANRERWQQRDPKLNKVAIWTYFENALRDPGLDEGATTVAYLPHKGWFWYIPLSGGKVSVGIVAERDYLFNGTTRGLEEIFLREIQNNQWIRRHLEPATQVGEYRITGEYSYRNQYSSQDGLVLAGDALGFLDPVFSTGVFLALRSGELVADATHKALEEGDIHAKHFVQYGRDMTQAIETMRKVVYAFYDEAFSFKDLLMKGQEMKADLTNCLVGNIEGKQFEQLFKAMAELADLPEPSPFGLSKADTNAA